MNPRYARHEPIPGWRQDKLSAATAVLIGIGALGTDVARILAQSGVRRLVLCDPDVVSESNLNRGSLFGPEDVGGPKVEVAGRVLRRLAPDLQVDARCTTLSGGVGLAELRDAALVISCLDSRAARLLLARRCSLVGAAMLDGGTHPWGGEIRYFPAGGACFGCGLTHRERAVRDDPWSCGDFSRSLPQGASAPVSALLASLLAVAATRLLLGLPQPGGTLRVDAASGATERIGHPRDPECPMHARIAGDAVDVVPLGAESTAGDLLGALGPGETALAWDSFSSPGGLSRPSVQLRDAAPGACLRELGIAPREVLEVVHLGQDRRTRYVELAGVSFRQGAHHDAGNHQRADQDVCPAPARP